ncbi:hypothetical protein GCM10028819_21800 [Spirosoma humi]
MTYKAITTLKKTDTEGRIPAYTLDQYVRSELSRQLIDAVKPQLLIHRSDQVSGIDPLESLPIVAFTTELILLKPEQWQLLKKSLGDSFDSLPSDQQQALQQLIDEVEVN